MTAIRSWLESLGLDQYADAFEANDIDVDLLSRVDDQTLKDIGVASAGHRLRLLGAIEARTKTDKPARDQALSGAISTAAESRPSSGSTEGERRQLTVLFCDLVGYTELASRLDPEVLQGIVRSYEDTCAACVTRYEGYVFQRLGDGIVAFFGYPLAHEGEAERAIRAGLEIIDALAQLEVSDAGHLKVRIGIATGLVVVSSAEKGAVGETMNLAARLQAIAQPGSIVVSERVHRLAGGTFNYEDLGEQTLKGITQPTHAYRILGLSEAASRFEAAAGESLTPLVGRELELGLLLERWALAQDGEGQVALLSGEPGIGKSRILDTLRERLQAQGAQALRFQCSPYYANSALWPSIDNFERALKFARDETLESKLDKLEALIAGHYGRPRSDVRFVASLLSIPCDERYGPMSMTPQKHKDETLRTLVDLTEAAARKKPSVMLFEDVHWADPTTLEVLDLLIDRVKGFPLLMVLTHRPEFASRWSQHGHVAAVNLSKLTRAQSTAMVSRISGGKHLPAELLEQIIAKTDGVPLFVEELTKSILESGELKDTGDRYEYVGSARSITIPATLRDSLMARLDRFAPVKEVAQIGAAIGREFSYELIAAVVPTSPTQLDSALTQLTDSGLAFRRGTPPDATYTFKHALVQDAAYDSLLKSRRQELHGKIARVIEERFPGIKDAEPEILAHHFAQAGDNARAVAYHEAAGQRSLARTALAEAARSFSDALELIPRLPDTLERDRTEVRVRNALGTTLMLFKGWQTLEVPQVLSRARDLSVKLGDPDSLVAAQVPITVHKIAAGDTRGASAAASELVEMGVAIADPRVQIAGALYANIVSHYLGKPEESLKHAAFLNRLYRPERDSSLIGIVGHNPKSFSLWTASYSYWILGRYREALAASEEQLEIARGIAHAWNLGWSLTGGSDVIGFMGDWRRQLELVEEARELARKHDLPFLEHVVCPYHEGFARIFGKDFARGEQCMRQGVERWAAAGGKSEQTQAYTLLAEALVGLGRYDEAFAEVTKASEMMDDTGQRHWEPEIYRVRGEIHAIRPGGSAELAETEFRRALDVARETHAKTWELRAAISLARLWQGQSRLREARGLLAPVYEWFQEGIETPDLKAARALLASLE